MFSRRIGNLVHRRGIRRFASEEYSDASQQRLFRFEVMPEEYQRWLYGPFYVLIGATMLCLPLWAYKASRSRKLRREALLRDHPELRLYDELYRFTPVEENKKH